jgi:hypothetical protein
VRFGLLALFATTVATQLLVNHVAVLDLSLWYGRYTALALAILGVLAVASFRASRGAGLRS